MNNILLFYLSTNYKISSLLESSYTVLHNKNISVDNSTILLIIGNTGVNYMLLIDSSIFNLWLYKSSYNSIYSLVSAVTRIRKLHIIFLCNSK